MRRLWIALFFAISVSMAISVSAEAGSAGVMRACHQAHAGTLRVTWQELSALYTRPPGTSTGIHNRELKEGRLNGERVFIKVLHARENDYVSSSEYQMFLNEVRWTQHLSDLGIGPYFHGVTVTPEGHLALVTELLEGHSSNIPRVLSLRMGFPLTPSLIEDFYRIRDFLLREKISPNDLEVMITRNKVYLIDPSQFREQATEGELQEIAENIDRFVQKLQRQR